jgi:hypothetical protein
MIVIVPVLALVAPAASKVRIGPYAVAAAVCLNGLQVLPPEAGAFMDDLVPLVALVGCWLALAAYARTNDLPDLVPAPPPVSPTRAAARGASRRG